jgi:hypothetical protein
MLVGSIPEWKLYDLPQQETILFCIFGVVHVVIQVSLESAKLTAQAILIMQTNPNKKVMRTLITSVTQNLAIQVLFN